MRLQDGHLDSQAEQFIDPASKDGALWTQGTTQLGVFPDSFDITAGPLGNEVDADDIGHEEIAVCYPVDEGGDTLTVNVTVLDYTNFQANSAVVQTTASASVGIYRSLYDISTIGARFPSDSVIACDSGDVNGDGVDEVVVAHLSNVSTVRVSVFSYVNDVQGPATLVEVGSYDLHPSGPTGRLTASVDVTLAPLTSNANREQIAVASVGNGSTFFSPSQFINVHILSSDSSFELSQEPAVFRSLSGIASMPSGCPQTTACGIPRVQLVSGLFQYNPGTGFDFDRHQLAVVDNVLFHDIVVQSFAVSDDLTTTTSLGSPVVIPNVGVSDTTNNQARRFSVAAGGFVGNGNVDNPQWSLVITNWESASNGFESGIGKQYLYWLKTQSIGDGALTLAFSRETCGTGNCSFPLQGNPNARLPVTQWDPLGESIYLGSPVHFTVDDLISTKYVIYEPPKHMRWVPDLSPPFDPFKGHIENVSRNTSTFISLAQGESNVFEFNNGSQSDWNAGGSVAVSASSTISGGVTIPAIASIKSETTVKTSVSASYDYDSKESEYNSSYSTETRNRTTATTVDDQLIYDIQLLDVWRYPMLGVELEDDLNAFYDIIFPSTIDQVEVSTSGIVLSWYQPRHENGNALSYPVLSGNSFDPPDCCAPFSFTDDQGNEITRQVPFFTNGIAVIGGNQDDLSMNFATAEGGGFSKQFSNSLKASADLSIGNKTKVKAVGLKAQVETEVSFNVHGGTSWGESATGSNTTTNSTGIEMAISSGNFSKAYRVAPVFYLANDGSTKAAHAVDLDLTGVTYFNAIYGRQPDPALNMPARFVPNILPSESLVWVVNDTSTVNKIRGFFITSPGVDPVTDQNIVFADAADAGQEVRLVVRVYNYSFVGFSGLDVKFEAVIYDSRGDQDIGDPVTLSCAEGSMVTDIALDGQQMTEAICIWDTTDFSPETPGSLREYRIYVTLDPDDEIQEIYNGTVGPGENNYGWGIVTIAHSQETFMFPTPTETHPQGADVSMTEASLAIEIAGQIETDDIVNVFLGQFVALRACIITDQTQTGYHHILIWEEDGLTGERNLIGDQLLQGINSEGRSCVWIRNYSPSSLGLKRLRAVVLESHLDALPGNHTDTLYINVNSTPTPALSIAKGVATHVGTDENNGRLSFVAKFHLEEENQKFDLSDTTLVFGNVLNEVNGAGELLPLVEAGGSGQPLTLQPQRGATPGRVTFKTDSGILPRVKIQIKRIQRDKLLARVHVDRSSILTPQHCDSSTELLTQIFLINTPDAPLELSIQEPWICSKNPSGKTTLKLNVNDHMN